MKKIIYYVRKYIREIVLVVIGIIVGIVFSKRQKEVKIVKEVKEKIDEVDKLTIEEKELFNKKLEAILEVKDDKQRMQGLLNLWEYLKD